MMEIGSEEEQLSGLRLPPGSLLLSFKFLKYLCSKQTKTHGEEKREFNLKVHVEANQAPLPGGMGRILDLFESITRSGAEP
jgi:hypothetical protein